MVLYCPLEAGFAQLFVLFMLFAGGMTGFLGFLNYLSRLIARKPKEPPKEEVDKYVECWKREMERMEAIRKAHDGAVIFLGGSDPCGVDPRSDYNWRLCEYEEYSGGVFHRIANFVLMLGSLGLLYGSAWLAIAILPRIFTLGCFQVMG